MFLNILYSYKYVFFSILFSNKIDLSQSTVLFLGQEVLLSFLKEETTLILFAKRLFATFVKQQKSKNIFSQLFDENFLCKETYFQRQLQWLEKTT